MNISVHVQGQEFWTLGMVRVYGAMPLRNVMILQSKLSALPLLVSEARHCCYMYRWRGHNEESGCLNSSTTAAVLCTWNSTGCRGRPLQTNTVPEVGLHPAKNSCKTVRVDWNRRTTAGNL